MSSAVCALKTLYKQSIPGQSTSYASQYSRRYLSDNLKKKYEQFQRQDGIPVYLKGGLSDRILFLLSAALCVIGVVDGTYTMMLMAFPKKKI
ncbi:hypothetical protein NQ315_016057 [Exocentrus adspersus]|uniref:Cytochrome c oxidase subunit VIIa n=1 Tax=Exocentrus adspersus TaxID=1586481 RepID=A0AAV8VL07_9CUCU|nr:hypothetical protein NQ315_016057 [Exocentrus adspersus]